MKTQVIGQDSALGPMTGQCQARIDLFLKGPFGFQTLISLHIHSASSFILFSIPFAHWVRDAWSVCSVLHTQEI